MTSERLRHAFVAAFALCVVSCGGDDERIPLLWVGSDRVPAPAAVSQSIFIVDAVANGTAKARVVVDTGAPVSLVDADAFRGEIPAGSDVVSTLSVGKLTLVRVPVVGITGFASSLESVLAGGLLGFTAFGQFPMSFNYRDRQVAFGGRSVPADVGEPKSVRFSLKGGGVGTIGDIRVATPPSRILVPVEVEGERHVFMVDTGASMIGVGSSIFGQLTSDGRGTATDDLAVVTGSASSVFTRLRSVVVGGLEVMGAPAVSGASIDALLDATSAETDETIDGFVGGSYLREFFVTVDYPDGKLVLRRYATRDHIQDEFQRVGITLRNQGGPGHYEYFVGQVFPGTDAESQSIQIDEQLLAIDGASLSSTDPVKADTLLLGTVGATHTLDLQGRAAVVRVDEILPLP